MDDTERWLTRRRLLGVLAGGVAVTGAGYAGARAVAKTGTVVARRVVAETREPRRTTTVLDVERNRDGSVDVRAHPDYDDRLADAPPVRVPADVHRELTDRFVRIRYHLKQSCPDARCSTPQVSRRAFNDAPLGSTVRLVYHGDDATPV
jgi:hypothetical protein